MRLRKMVQTAGLCLALAIASIVWARPVSASPLAPASAPVMASEKAPGAASPSGSRVVPEPQDYARREAASPALEGFAGGHEEVVVVSTCAVVVILLVLLILIV